MPVLWGHGDSRRESSLRCGAGLWSQRFGNSRLLWNCQDDCPKSVSDKQKKRCFMFISLDGKVSRSEAVCHVSRGSYPSLKHTEKNGRKRIPNTWQCSSTTKKAFLWLAGLLPFIHLCWNHSFSFKVQHDFWESHWAPVPQQTASHCQVSQYHLSILFWKKALVVSAAGEMGINWWLLCMTWNKLNSVHWVQQLNCCF